MQPSESNETTSGGNLPFEQVYQRLRSIAHRERRRFSAGHTLSTTALVHEVYLDVFADSTNELAPRDFFAYAARSMRNLLIDHARRCLRIKHGGGQHRRTARHFRTHDQPRLALGTRLAATRTSGLSESPARPEKMSPRIALSRQDQT